MTCPPFHRKGICNCPDCQARQAEFNRQMGEILTAYEDPSERFIDRSTSRLATAIAVGGQQMGRHTQARQFHYETLKAHLYGVRLAIRQAKTDLRRMDLDPLMADLDRLEKTFFALLAPSTEEKVR